MGQSEVGILSSDNSMSPSQRTSTNSEVSPKNNMATMVTDVIAAVMGQEDKQEKKKTKSGDSFEELPLKDIMMLMNKHKSYLKFLKDCDMCTPERTATIVREIDELFEIVNRRKRKRYRDLD